MKGNSFGITLGVFLTVYVLLIINSSASVSSLWFLDVGEIVCMIISLVYLYKAIKAKQSSREQEAIAKLEKLCLTYAFIGLALKIVSSHLVTTL